MLNPDDFHYDFDWEVFMYEEDDGSVQLFDGNQSTVLPLASRTGNKCVTVRKPRMAI